MVINVGVCLTIYDSVTHHPAITHHHECHAYHLRSNMSMSHGSITCSSGLQRQCFYIVMAMMIPVYKL